MFIKVEPVKSGLRDIGGRGLEKKEENVHKYVYHYLKTSFYL